jgi:benzoate-CoA ligase family protein
MTEDFTARRAYNAAAEFVDANVARGRGHKVAFADADRTLTYGDLQKETCRFARGLAALGLRQESRVVLLMLDTVDFPIAFWGAIRAGMVPIPLNTLLTPEQYAYMLDDSRAEAIVVSPPLVKAIAPILGDLTSLRTAVVAGPDAHKLGALDTHSFADVLARGAPDVFTADTISDEVAFWLYSSGSTGAPKGAKHVHASLMATGKLYAEGVLGMQTNDVVYSAAKLFFAYGLGNAMTFPMMVGASAVLLPDRPTPDAVFDIMRRHRPTIFFGVPTLYAALLAHKDIGPGAGSDRLRLCISAGEALPAHIGARWKEVVGLDILDGIGSTEMLATMRASSARTGASCRPARSAN